MILFLDFDGVLHPDEAYRVKGRPVLKAKGELFMWCPLLVDVLAHRPDIQIVLSTSWARELSFSRARRWLPDALRARVIGSTWHSSMGFQPDGSVVRSTWWDTVTRYQQIKRYVNRAGIANWTAIDDNDEGWAEVDRGNLVHTNGATGLSDLAVINQLVACLDKPPRPQN